MDYPCRREEWNPAKRAVKPDPDPAWGAPRPQVLGDSTGVRLNGFFASTFTADLVGDNTAGDRG